MPCRAVDAGVDGGGGGGGGEDCDHYDELSTEAIKRDGGRDIILRSAAPCTALRYTASICRFTNNCSPKLYLWPKRPTFFRSHISKP